MYFWIICLQNAWHLRWHPSVKCGEICTTAYRYCHLFVQMEILGVGNIGNKHLCTQTPTNESSNEVHLYAQKIRWCILPIKPLMFGTWIRLFPSLFHWQPRQTLIQSLNHMMACIMEQVLRDILLNIGKIHPYLSIFVNILDHAGMVSMARRGQGHSCLLF